MPLPLISLVRRRWPFFALGIVVVLPLILLFAMRSILVSLTTPAALVERLESEWNARVEVGGVDVSLFGSGPNVRLRNVRIAPRDHLADNAVPLATRPEIASPVFEADAVDLEIRLAALLRKRLEVIDMTWTGFRAALRQDKKKAWNTEPFGRRPEVVAGKPRRESPPAAEKPKPERDPATGETDAAAMKPEAVVFMARNLPMAASAERMAVESSALAIDLVRKGTMINLDDFSLVISDLDVDPANLSARNTATVHLDTRARVHTPSRNLENASLTLKGGGELRPFDPETGALAPVADLVVDLGDSSVISLLPTLEKLRTRLDALSRFGIKLVDDFGTGIVFAPGTKVHMRLEHGRLTLVEELPATVSRFNLILLPGSWYELGSNEHEFKALLHGGDEQTSNLRSNIASQASRLPERAGTVLMEELDKSFFGSGRFEATFTSTGDLGEPDVKLDNELPDLGRILGGILGGLGIDSESRDELRDTGRDLLRGLLNRNREQPE